MIATFLTVMFIAYHLNKCLDSTEGVCEL